ncbi:MAG: transposase [Spirochaetes bacterium]|nr:transposase [Spirochaetota bacterium]
MSEYLSSKEIAYKLNICRSTVIRRANKEQWPCLSERGRGGIIKKYHIDTLPADIRFSLSRPAQSPPTAGGGTPAPLPAVPSCPVIIPGLTYTQSRIAAARYDLVAAYIKAKEDERRKKKQSGNGHRVCIAATEFIDAYNTGVPYPDLFAVLGPVALKTIEKWKKHLVENKFDMACCAPQYGQHLKGTTKVTSGEIQTMLRFALNPNRMRISQVIRWTKKAMKAEGIESPSSEATLRRALAAWRDQNYDRWTVLRDGEKALTDQVLPYIERDSSLLSVGDILVADGHKLNFRVINPETGKPARATLLMWYDWASRYPAGWYVMMRENTQCIHAALRRAILALGMIPKYVLLDNGKAFRSKFFTKTTDFKQAGIAGLYARLGIETHFAWPYNARSKPVERFFATFNELERLLPSYTGANILDKPAHLHRNEKLLQRLHDDFVPTIDQADLIIHSWIVDEYALREHRGLMGRTPADVWTAGRGDGIDEAGLRYLMMSIADKKIGRNGVNIHGVNYYDEALYGLREEVQVRYDILNMEQVYIYSSDGSRFICTARPVRSVHPLAKMSGNPLDLEQVKRGIEMQRRLKKSTEREARAAASQIAPWEFPEVSPAEPLPMSRPQIEDLERQASEVEVIDMEECRESTLYNSMQERYESLVVRRARGFTLNADEMAIMELFENTNEYRLLREYFEELEHTTIAQQ